MRKKKAKKNKYSVEATIRTLLDHGITYEEIAAEIPCSKMTLVNWVNGVHAARKANFDAIRRAYEKFEGEGALKMLPSEMLQKLKDERRFSVEELSEKLSCKEETVEMWFSGVHTPRGINRRKIRELYFDNNAR